MSCRRFSVRFCPCTCTRMMTTRTFSVWWTVRPLTRLPAPSLLWTSKIAPAWGRGQTPICDAWPFDWYRMTFFQECRGRGVQNLEECRREFLHQRQVDGLRCGATAIWGRKSVRSEPTRQWCLDIQIGFSTYQPLTKHFKKKLFLKNCFNSDL